MTAEASPAGPHKGVDAAYIPPEIGFDPLRDAVAAIRCAIGGDTVGLHALLTGTTQPRNLAGMIASIAAAVFARLGLDPGAVDRTVAEVSTDLGDFLLDQPVPGARSGAG